MGHCRSHIHFFDPVMARRIFLEEVMFEELAETHPRDRVLLAELV
jgi:hypothetical protein